MCRCCAGQRSLPCTTASAWPATSTNSCGWARRAFCSGCSIWPAAGRTRAPSSLRPRAPFEVSPPIFSQGRISTRQKRWLDSAMRSTAPSWRLPAGFAAAPHSSVATTRTWGRSATPTPATLRDYCAMIPASLNWRPAACRWASSRMPLTAPPLAPCGPEQCFWWSRAELWKPSTTTMNSAWKARGTPCSERPT